MCKFQLYNLYYTMFGTECDIIYWCYYYYYYFFLTSRFIHWYYSCFISVYEYRINGCMEYNNHNNNIFIRHWSFVDRNRRTEIFFKTLAFVKIKKNRLLVFPSFFFYFGPIGYIIIIIRARYRCDIGFLLPESISDPYSFALFFFSRNTYNNIYVYVLLLYIGTNPNNRVVILYIKKIVRYMLNDDRSRGWSRIFCLLKNNVNLWSTTKK